MRSIKISLLFIVVLTTNVLFAQGGQKWSVNGNATTNGDFIGTTNNEPIVFKTDNQTRLRINANGNFIFKQFDGVVSPGLFTYDVTGKLVGLAFTGNASDMLLGNGLFASVAASTGWNVGVGTTYTMNKVGVGIQFPVEKLEVNGNAIFNGSVAASSFIVGDVSSTGKNLRISTNICLDGYDPLTGMRNELCVFYKPLFVNSKHGYDMNTIINHDNLGNVGIGTDNPITKLDVNGDFKVNGNMYVNRINDLPGDSLIHFGDSSMVVNSTTHRIYATPNFYIIPGSNPPQSAYAGGMGIGGTASGIGYTSAFGENALAIGYNAKAGGKKSISLGNFVSTSGPLSGDAHNIVIGRGVSSSQLLVNNITNSLMVGFNSNIPTLFVSPASGVGTTGAIGIGTTCIPADCKLAVDGTIKARRVIVETANWCDYVFADSYNLIDLDSLESYILEYNHLPEMTSENEAIENGVDLNEMTKNLLKRAEENTLYIIQLEKENKVLRKSQDELQKRLEKIEELLCK